MAPIRRPRSNLIFNIITPIPTWHLHTHTLRLTPMTPWSLVQSKSSVNVISFLFCKHPSFFPRYSPFHTLFWISKMLFTSKHLCAFFLLFFFFLSSNKSQEKVSLSTVSKATWPKLFFSISSAWLSSNVTRIQFIILLFLNLYSYHCAILESRAKCPFCPLLYLLPTENTIKLTFCVLFAQKNAFSCSFLIFDFHFLI